jgi:hypothetical protein
LRIVLRIRNSYLEKCDWKMGNRKMELVIHIFVSILFPAYRQAGLFPARLIRSGGDGVISKA